MDNKIRLETLDSAINDEGINYTWWNKNDKQIENEIINKTDIYYGDETSSDIQTQPYIIIRKRLPVVTVREIANGMGLSSEKISLIVGDADNVNNIGDNNQLEKEDSTCTIITKLWRDGKTIHYSKATKFVQLEKVSSSTLCIFSHIAYPYGLITIQPLTGDCSAKSALSTRSLYHCE